MAEWSRNNWLKVSFVLFMVLCMIPVVPPALAEDPAGSVQDPGPAAPETIPAPIEAPAGTSPVVAEELVSSGPDPGPATSEMILAPTEAPTQAPPAGSQPVEVPATVPGEGPVPPEVTPGPTDTPGPMPGTEPAAVETTPGPTVEPTTLPTPEPSISLTGPVSTVPTTPPDNQTCEGQPAGMSSSPAFDLSFTSGLSDPPLNTTNLQGEGDSRYWEINATTGSGGYYPLDLGGLITKSLVGIWIHDVSNIVLDGKGQTLEYTGQPDQGATGVVINGTSSSNIQIVNLKFLNWDTAISILNGNNIYVMDNVAVTGNRASGGTTGSGIVATDSTGVFIASNLSAGSVSIQDTARDGIVFDRVTGGLINNTLISNSLQEGVNLTSSHQVTVQNVTANGNRAGIALHSSDDNTLSGNTARGDNNPSTMDYGFYLDASNNNKLTGNAASDNVIGYALYHSDNNELTGNSGTNNHYTEWGDGRGGDFYLFGSSGNRLIGNTGTGSNNGYTREYGFFLDNSTKNTVVSNTDRFHDYGIRLKDSDQNTIARNAITISHWDSMGWRKGWGIALERSDYNEITENSVTGSHTSDHWTTDMGYLLQDSHYNNLTGNTAYGNDDAFIITNSRYNNLTKNSATAHVSLGFLFSGSDNNTFFQNSAASPTYSSGYPRAFYFGGSNNNTIVENTVTGHDRPVILSDSDRNLLTGNIVTGGEHGFQLLGGSDDNTLTGNTARYASGNGFLISGSNNNALTENKAIGNRNSGFALDQASYNNLSSNTADANNGYGYSLSRTSFNTLTGNIAKNNGWSNGWYVSGAGFSVSQGKNDTLAGNTALNNFDGFVVLQSDGTVLADNVAQDNNMYASEEDGHNGFTLTGSSHTTLRNNTADGNPATGILVTDYDSWGASMPSAYNVLDSNTVSNNGNYGISISGAGFNTISSNNITGNGRTGLVLAGKGNNLVYNNYFNNADNALVSPDSTGNSWSVSPVLGPNKIGGPYIGGNFWAFPNGTGWSETNSETSMGFTVPYSIPTGSPAGTSQVMSVASGPSSSTTDLYPIVKTTTTPGTLPTTSPTTSPTVVPSPSPSGDDSNPLPFVPSDSGDAAWDPSFDGSALSGIGGALTPPGLKPVWDSAFSGDTFPAAASSCGSYDTSVTVKNTGSTGWSSTDGVLLQASSPDGLTISPSKIPVPEGVVIAPDESWTFPVTVQVPCSLNSGSGRITFRMAREAVGGVDMPFGETFTKVITVSPQTARSAEAVSGGKVMERLTVFPGVSVSPTKASFKNLVSTRAPAAPVMKRIGEKTR